MYKLIVRAKWVQYPIFTGSLFGFGHRKLQASATRRWYSLEWVSLTIVFIGFGIAAHPADLCGALHSPVAKTVHFESLLKQDKHLIRMRR